MFNGDNISDFDRNLVDMFVQNTFIYNLLSISRYRLELKIKNTNKLYLLHLESSHLTPT